MGNSLFLLEGNDIEGKGDLTEEEKTKLKNYLKEQNLLIKKEDVNKIKQKEPNVKENRKEENIASKNVQDGVEEEKKLRKRTKKMSLKRVK